MNLPSSLNVLILPSEWDFPNEFRVISSHYCRRQEFLVGYVKGAVPRLCYIQNTKIEVMKLEGM